MTIALRELRRRPGQFLPVVVAMTLLVVLLVVLGGFLDGLSRSQTGVLRAQGERLLVLSSDADLTPTRSSIPDGAPAALRDVEGVTSVGTLSRIATTASAGDDIIDIVLVGYDLATEVLPDPPAAGEVVVDRAMVDQLGVAVGDELTVGPENAAVTITELVGDVSAGAPTVWVAADDWTTLAAAADPTNRPRAQVAVVEGDVTDADLAAAVDGIDVATVAELIAADDVVTQQTATFQGIIGVTFLVSLLVVALFFVLLTIERTTLYAVLKALGGGTRTLLGGLAAQAAILAVVAVALGVGLGVVGLGLVPADLPVVVVPGRLAVIAAATVAVAVVGALTTLRRLLAIDPADAIG